MNDSDSNWIRTLGQVSSVGLLIVVSVLIGLGMGVWLDGKLGTKPWLAFIFTILGLAAGIYESARIIINAIRSQD